VSWLQQVKAAARARGLPDPCAPDNIYRPGKGVGYARTALEQEVNRVLSAANGTRNHSLNRAAFSLGQLVAGGELDRSLVEQELTRAAQLVGLSPTEIVNTIRSGLDAGAQHPRTVPPPKGVTELSGTGPGQVGTAEQAAPEVDGDQVAAWVHENLPRLDWHALWEEEDPEEWIVEPLIPARRLVALYSAPKVGKSLLMLELAVAVARGERVLGVVPDRPRRVLYVDFENDPRGDIRARLTAMGYGPDDLDNLVYLSFPQLSALDSANGGRQLLAAAQTYGCELVVIDTVSRAIAGEENENDTWLSFYRHTGRALKSAGIAMVRLDHTGKDETKGQRGGSAKSGDVDAVWRMSKLSEETFRLDCEAHRMPLIETTLVIHRKVEPKLRHQVDATGAAGVWSSEVAAVVRLLDELSMPADTGAERARRAVRDAGLRASNRVIAEAVKTRKRSMSVDPDLSGTGRPP